MPCIKDGFNEFYKRNFATVYRVCYIYMQDPQDAEDCTEDTFLKAMSSEMSFKDEKHERSWLAVVAGNICKDKLKHWWRKKTEDIADHEDISVNDSYADDTVLTAVMALPAKYKVVVYLYYYEGYKTDEIAKKIKKPASTVRNLLRDARNKLKITLGDDIIEQ